MPPMSDGLLALLIIVILLFLGVTIGVVMGKGR
jgi:hypothetical protein